MTKAQLQQRRDAATDPNVRERCDELLKRRSDEAERAKAADMWSKMDANEKRGVRFGMFPSEKMEEAEAQGYDDHKLAIALMNCAKQDGGMIG